MMAIQSLHWKYLAFALIGCWACGGLAAKAEESLVPIALSTADGAAAHVGDPASESYAQCYCPPTSSSWYNPLSWFRSKSSGSHVAVCNGGQGSCNVHPDPVFGGSLQATMQAQISKGEAALMVLYNFDFEPGEAQLNYRGRLQLNKIAQRLRQTTHPVIIEESRDNHDLDIARYATVLSELSSLSFSVPPERVMVGRPLARGMDGLDAEQIHLNLMRQTIGAGMAAPVVVP